MVYNLSFFLTEKKNKLSNIKKWTPAHSKLY